MNNMGEWPKAWEIAILAALCGIGALTLVGGAVYGIQWMVEHVRVVP